MTNKQTFMERTTKGGIAGKRVPRDAVRAREEAKMRTEDREDVGGSLGCAWRSALRPIAQSVPVKQGSTTVTQNWKRHVWHCQLAQTEWLSPPKKSHVEPKPPGWYLEVRPLGG